MTFYLHSKALSGGRNELHSKCSCPQGHVGSNPTASANNNMCLPVDITNGGLDFSKPPFVSTLPCRFTTVLSVGQCQRERADNRVLLWVIGSASLRLAL